MISSSSQKLPIAFLIAGLLMIAFTQIISRYIPITDLLRGALTGAGIGLEIMAVIKIRSARETVKASTESR